LPEAGASAAAEPAVFPAAVSIVTLGVADLARSIAFYEALGRQRTESSMDDVIAWFDIGGVYLGLYPDDELADDSGYPRDSVVPAGTRATTFPGITLAVNVTTDEEVDAAIAVAVAAGAQVRVGPMRTEYGVYHACFSDPDGYVWEVAHAGFPFVDGRVVIP
jgi:hypothetical protein